MLVLRHIQEREKWFPTSDYYHYIKWTENPFQTVSKTSSGTPFQSCYHILKTGFFLPCAQNKYNQQLGKGHCIYLLLPVTNQITATLFNILVFQKCQTNYFKAESTICLYQNVCMTSFVYILHMHNLHKCLSCLIKMGFLNIMVSTKLSIF